ncbi:MAG: nuclear transport factor 2 family protein [Vicinamibacterales bacterium]
MPLWSPANASVWRLVEGLNHAWVSGPLGSLDSIYHEAIVVVDRDGRQLARGREEAIELYRAFLEDATPTDFRPFEPFIHVDVVGGTAVAQYKFEIGYEQGGRPRTAMGRDLLVLTYANNGWQVLWRQYWQDAAEPGA